MTEPPARPPRLAFLLLRGLDHFAPDLIAGLPRASGWEVRPFHVAGPADLAEALAWAAAPGDAVWFEFCWPPFPRLIAETDFGPRRVMVRVHRIEAMETPHVAQTDWCKVDDAIVVSPDMAARVRRAAPGILGRTRLWVVLNGLDTARFVPSHSWNPHRIGWCGLMIARKNPALALQILHALRRRDPAYRLHICANGGDGLAGDSFLHLMRRMALQDAVRFDGAIAREAMPAWHAANGVLLHTSLHESFGYAIAEAAAAGADLCVLDHPGAADFWPDAVRFATVEEAAAIIQSAAPNRWRAHVERNFSLDRQLEAVAALLNETPARQVA
ncbi:MAG: glycosyltransferase family 4 protein [Proteobacteria bacterium]|nr:glycosyltransferase family 4 protein [Pseudomonadota bacterium]